MKLVEVTNLDQNRWNALVLQEASFALHQSWEWGVFKEKIGWKALRFAVEEDGLFTAGVQMLVKPLPTRLADVAYVPRGPVGDWMNTQKASLLFSAMEQAARGKRAIFLKIEPPVHCSVELDQMMCHYGYRSASLTNQPCTTLILDLSKDLDTILANMRKKTRQYIRSAEREGITVREGRYEDLPVFYEIMRETGRREKFAPRSAHYYEQEWKTFVEKGNCVLLMACHQDRPIAGSLVFRSGKHAADLHGGSRDGFGNLHPNHLLIWKAIQWAINNLCDTYDLWGIPDELGTYAGSPLPVMPERTDGLWGVYRFKSGFCSNIVCYARAYDRVYAPLLNPLLNSRLLNSDNFERVAIMLDSFITGNPAKKR